MAQRSRRSRPLMVRIVMAVAAVGLFIVGYQWGNHYQRVRDEPLRMQGVLIRPVVRLPDAALDGLEGALAGADLVDHWSLVALASPASAAGHRSVARMVEIANRLADEPVLRRNLWLLLISADDIPGLARDFERLTPALRVLSLAPAAMTTLRAALGAGDASPPEDADAPPPLFLIGPQAQLVALFPGSQSAASIAEDLRHLAEHPDRVAPNSDDT